ncbi:MAG: dihydrolipoyl dehydrogenase [Deltaproteobacteria bacterium]|nr:dihydrolipoyl dehydrogenase [Deltaproteobacteria bacterium]
METVKYQAVVVGAGPGGYVCAIRLAQLGVKTLCIERDNWGGVCLNVGCIPSKALITAAKKYNGIKKFSEMGIELTSEASINMNKLQEWKGGIVKRLTGGIDALLKSNKADRMLGEAKFLGGTSLEVTKTDGTVVRVECDDLVIATGSRPIEIPGYSYADDRILDSTKALALSEIPKRLAVIGGGYIGLEMGMMLSKLGSDVTVIEMADQVLANFDPDVVKIINRQMKKQKMTVLTNARAQGWEEGDDSAIVKVETPKGTKEVAADKILVTVGRRPNSEPLTDIGVELDKRGFVVVNDQQQTSNPNVYAIGDITGRTMLAHGASYEAEVAAEVIAGHKRTYQARTVPAVVFTDPEIATAGLQEHEAKAKGISVKVGNVPFKAIGRALTTGETDGFIKVILDDSDKRVIGITIVGPNASDLISEAALAVEMDAEALDLGLTIHPHPTLGEGMMEAAKHAIGEAIHWSNR